MILKELAQLIYRRDVQGDEESQWQACADRSILRAAMFEAVWESYKADSDQMTSRSVTQAIERAYNESNKENHDEH